MQTDDRHVVPLILLAQAGSSIAVAVVAWAVSGGVAAASALLGGAAAVAPNAFLACRLLAAGSSAKELLRSAWLGAAGKLLLTALAFGAIFALVRPLSLPALFAGVLAALFTVPAGLLYGAPRPLAESTTKS